MELIHNQEQLINNINTLEGYLTEGNEYANDGARSLVQRGRCFVAYQVDKELRFAPSRFIGYIDNKLDRHSASQKKDGRETNKAINQILKSNPLEVADLNLKYFEYCNGLGMQPSKNVKKFWLFNIDKDFNDNIELTGEFPEGKIVERTHNARERNTQVITLAKANFKKLYGRLFCQVCGFDFEKTYGSIGEDFIEGHHTIAVCDMAHGHKTKTEDIAMLCANCHRMVHKKRPWLTMKDLNRLINKDDNQ